MNLYLKKLQPDCDDRSILDAINKEAFPPSEYMPSEEMFEFAEKTNSDVLGIYDCQQMVGFILFLKNEECGYVFFLAIDQNVRSKGYGSMALKALADTYPYLQIILDFEELDENAENIAQRVRRKEFYLRNGFCETGRYTLLRGYRFEVVCTNGSLRVEPFKKLIKVIHAHCPYFPDEMI